MLEDAHMDLLMQAGALDRFACVLLERLANDDMADLATVVLDAVSENIRKDAETIGAALDHAREEVA